MGAKKERIILFDLDGTLIDSTEAILRSFRKSYEELGGDCPDEKSVKALIGHPLSDMFSIAGVERERIDEYVYTYKESYRKIHTAMTELLPGAREALETAYAEARLGVVTTKTGKYSMELLEHFGISEIFETLVGSEDVKRHKPHPEPIFEALSRMGYESEECWMIGDTCMDMEAARAAKVGAVGVTCGYGREDELKSCASFVSKSVHEAVTRILET